MNYVGRRIYRVKWLKSVDRRLPTSEYSTHNIYARCILVLCSKHQGLGLINYLDNNKKCHHLKKLTPRLYTSLAPSLWGNAATNIWCSYLSTATSMRWNTQQRTYCALTLPYYGTRQGSHNAPTWTWKLNAARSILRAHLSWATVRGWKRWMSWSSP